MPGGGGVFRHGGMAGKIQRETEGQIATRCRGGALLARQSHLVGIALFEAVTKATPRPTPLLQLTTQRRTYEKTYDINYEKSYDINYDKCRPSPPVYYNRGPYSNTVQTRLSGMRHN